MKPPLVVGFGNVLAGDDGVGAAVVARLAADPRLPAGVEVVYGGTDLLRRADDLVGRERVVIVDARLHDGATTSVDVVEAWGATGGGRREDAHCLGLLQALDLLRAVSPELARVPVTLVAVGIREVRVGASLSATLEAEVPRIAERVLGALQRRSVSAAAGAAVSRPAPGPGA